MRRFLVAVCLLAHTTYGSPQRGVQLGGGQPRPVTFAGQQQQQPGNFGPSYTQSLSFGPADAGIRSGAPLSYRSPQPVVLQQGRPASPTPSPQSSFPAFPSPTPFPSIAASPSPGARGSPISLRAPQPADDEYEYEDEEEAPKPPVRPAPVPQRAPVRISQPATFSQGPQRLVVPQSQPQAQAPIRQRQPVPQRPSVSVQPQYTPQQPAPQRVVASAPAQQASRGQQVPQFGIDGKRTRLTTPPPIQTVNRYMRQNEDGSITWGYENEDGTFKEETIGADCVVRGKYGYVDPDGQKREYEYQSGNPCDPNKKDQEEEEEEEERDGPGPRQQIQGVINARPRPAQQRRPVALQPQYQAQYAQQGQ